MNDEPRYRCPKTGRWVSEWRCMCCNVPPKGYIETNISKPDIGPDGKNYWNYSEYCWAYNMLDPDSKPIVESRWDNKGRDRRKEL